MSVVWNIERVNINGSLIYLVIAPTSRSIPKLQDYRLKLSEKLTHQIMSDIKNDLPNLLDLIGITSTS
ncbi:MAG: hypothetical protein WB586_21650 [Chthoniobacterales bacterium]